LLKQVNRIIAVLGAFASLDFVPFHRMTETSETPQSYEELFAHRFTSEDSEYQQYLNRPADLPPPRAKQPPHIE